MELTHRDLHILKLVNTFTQLASTQLTELVFTDRSHSVPDRVLSRLVRTRYLSRTGRRAPGDKGGASPYVYKLGRYGRVLFEVDGRQSYAVNDHALMIADAYLDLHRAENTGLLTLTRWEVEFPLPHVRADLLVSVDFPEQRRSSSYFLEIDLGSEAPVRIKEKIAGYWRAFQTSEGEFFPYVVFVVRQEARRREIERIIAKLPDTQQEMVRVFLLTELIPKLVRL